MTTSNVPGPWHSTAQCRPFFDGLYDVRLKSGVELQADHDGWKGKWEVAFTGRNVSGDVTHFRRRAGDSLEKERIEEFPSECQHEEDNDGRCIHCGMEARP